MHFDDDFNYDFDDYDDDDDDCNDKDNEDCYDDDDFYGNEDFDEKYYSFFSAVKFAGTGPTEEYGIRESFKLYNDENDIFLCSWGPGDMLGSKIGYMYPTVKPAIKRAAEKVSRLFHD